MTALYGNYECAAVLIKHGFDPMYKANVLYDLIDYKDKHDWDYHKVEVHYPINYMWEDLEKIAKLLLSSGVDVNYQSYGKLTVLHQAANDKNANSVQFVDLFLQNGADVNIQTERYPVNVSSYHGSARIESYHESLGVGKHQLMLEQTPLHLALRASKLEGGWFHPVDTIDNKNSYRAKTSELPENRRKTVELLLKYNADPNICDHFGNNFLHYAAACGFFGEIVDATIESSRFIKIKTDEMLKNSIDKTNEFGDTPLILGLQLMWDQEENVMLKTVSTLHENGANLSHKNDFGYSPLLIAKMRNLKTIIEYLEKHSAKMGIKGEVTLNDQLPSVYGMEKEELFKIVESYGFDKYGCRESRSEQKSTSEYLRKLVMLDLGRFSAEYKWHGYKAFGLKLIKVRVDRFSSLRSISKFITSVPELRTVFVDKFSNGRVFKEELYVSEEFCIICLTDAPERTFLPCGHESMCEECIEYADFEKCPICKRKIEIIL